MSSFSWENFLALAESLTNDEAAWRSAVSRAYYAAFHAAKSYQTRVYGALSGAGSDHERTWRAFASSSNAKEQLVGNCGDDLKRLRVNADYKIEAAVTRATAMQAIASAKKVRKYLDELATG